MQTFEKSSPESQGLPSTAILAFIKAAEEINLGLHSLILLRHGRQIAEGYWSPYQASEPHMLFSLSKSFTSTAVGLAVAEGKLSLDDAVISFFPQWLPETINDNLKAMQVRHLLTMTAGHVEDSMMAIDRQPEGNWVQNILAWPVEKSPGTHFLYNTGATYLLSAIVQQVTGAKLVDYLQPRLFTPLGIQNPYWESSPQDINTGGFGLNLTTAEIARFGQLYLQKGVWQGQTLIPAHWMEEATSLRIVNGDFDESDWGQGYGYQFWRCRHNAYRGDGAFGQFCIVMPDQEAVLALTASVEDMQVVLNLVWQHLLAAMQPAPLPENPADQQALTEKLNQLTLPPLKSKTAQTVAAQYNGKRFALAENPYGLTAFTFDFEADGATITFERGDWSDRLVAGEGYWRKGEFGFSPQGQRKVGVSGGWTGEDTYLMQVYFLTSSRLDGRDLSGGDVPFGLTLSCHFEADKLRVDLQGKPSFSPGTVLTLEGQLKD